MTTIDLPPITAIYVPGDRPDRFVKAIERGADLVILDLEDAVAPDAKAAARRHVVDWLQTSAAGFPDTVIEVRVNAADGDDLAALADAHASGVAFGIRLPKVERPGDLDAVLAALPGVAVSALVETAAGVVALDEIAAADGVTSIGLGEADLASDLGATDTSVLDYARMRVLYAARAAGLPAPMASVYPAIADLDGLAADTARWRAAGFVGRTGVHPSQLPVIRAAFAPSAEEQAWAAEVLAVMGSGGVARLADGSMVDPAMIGRAHRITALTAATESPAGGVGHRTRSPE